MDRSVPSGPTSRYDHCPTSLTPSFITLLGDLSETLRDDLSGRRRGGKVGMDNVQGSDPLVCRLSRNLMNGSWPM